MVKLSLITMAALAFGSVFGNQSDPKRGLFYLQIKLLFGDPLIDGMYIRSTQAHSLLFPELGYESFPKYHVQNSGAMLDGSQVNESTSLIVHGDVDLDPVETAVGFQFLDKSFLVPDKRGAHMFYTFAREWNLGLRRLVPLSEINQTISIDKSVMQKDIMWAPIPLFTGSSEIENCFDDSRLIGTHQDWNGWLVCDSNLVESNIDLHMKRGTILDSTLYKSCSRVELHATPVDRTLSDSIMNEELKNWGNLVLERGVMAPASMAWKMYEKDRGRQQRERLR